jgi:hypothetical protein
MRKLQFVRGPPFPAVPAMPAFYRRRALNDRSNAVKTGIEPSTTRVIVAAANHFTESPWATLIHADNPRGIVPAKRSKVVMMPPIVTTRCEPRESMYAQTKEMIANKTVTMSPDFASGLNPKAPVWGLYITVMMPMIRR